MIFMYGLIIYYFLSNSFAPNIKVSTSRTTKIKNKTFAIPAALEAIPVKPNKPAIIAITRKINAQRNISYFLNLY
jgi:hypothetical protein